MDKSSDVMMANGSYFPLLVRYADMQDTTVVMDPWDIRSGEPFVVLQVRYLDSSENT